jgi:hypothetical protein
LQKRINSGKIHLENIKRGKQMKALRNIAIDVGLILSLLAILYFTNNEETRALVDHGDAGRIIGTFGILWAIGSVFSARRGWMAFGINICCALSCMIFGYFLNEYGIFHGIMSLGFLILFFTWILGAFHVNPPLAGILGLIGLALIGTGYSMRRHSIPTQKPVLTTEEIGNCAGAKWRIHLQNILHLNSYPTEQFYSFIGPTHQAQQEVERLRKLHNLDKIDVDLVLCSVPKERAIELGELEWRYSEKWADY